VVEKAGEEALVTREVGAQAWQAAGRVVAFAEPVGADRSSTSCDLGIFMYQPTESVATSEVQVGMDLLRWEWSEWSEWCCLMQCAMWAVLVEVRYVLGQNVSEVAAVDDQYPVKQLAAYGANPSFGD
jgi:hypothetical protein